MKKILILITISSVIPMYGQTLDQQLRRAEEVGAITSSLAQDLRNQKATQLNNGQFYRTAPSGISSLFMPPELIESSRMGNLTVYYPKGYGDNTLHYGIWNAIPFVVFDNELLEVRFGLIFEHRQVGFVPDDWVSTTITGQNLPEINFLIPNSKTFLSFTHGSSQWRSTVLLTEDQVKQLLMYANSLSSSTGYFTISHRFTDSSVRPYLIGERHKQLFQVMIELYRDIGNIPEVKKFRSSDAFPAGAFFDDLTVESISENIFDIEEQIIEGEEYTDEYNEELGEEYADEYVDEYADEYGEEYADEYGDEYADEYGEEYGDDEYGYDEYGYDE